jgi:hypothetical protein
MKKLIYILSLIILTTSSFGQRPLSTVEDRKYFIGNTLTSGLISGIQSCIIHKPKHQSFGKTFLKGFSKGFIGGTFQYSSEKLIQFGSEKNTLSYVWPARFLNSAGSSIVLNSSQNRKMFSTFSINVYFLNINYDFEKNIFNTKIDPYSAGSALLLSINKNYRFDFKNTLLSGTMIFENKEESPIVDGGDIYEFGTSGQNYGNTLSYKTCKQYFYDFYENPFTIDGVKYTGTKVIKSIIDLHKQTISHEIIHTFQYEQFQALNLISTDKICKLINTKVNNYLNINFNFIPFYLLNQFISGYNNNYFENQANYFGKSRYFDINSAHHSYSYTEK